MHMWPDVVFNNPPPPPPPPNKKPPQPPTAYVPPPPPPPPPKRVKEENEIFVINALAIDIEKEEEMLKLSVGALLAKFTNATDTNIDKRGCILGDSDSSESDESDESDDDL